MPLTALPEITFRAPAASPPTTLSAPKIATPLAPLPTSASPAASVPIRLPRTALKLAAVASTRPSPPLPEITLPAPAVVPPIVLPSPWTSIPIQALPSAAVARRVGADPVAGDLVVGRWLGEQNAAVGVARDGVRLVRGGAADSVAGAPDPHAAVAVRRARSCRRRRCRSGCPGRPRRRKHGSSASPAPTLPDRTLA